MFLFACGGGSTFNVQNPPPPPQNTVSIAFKPEPSGSLNVGFSESVTAVVTNDPNNYGVDWTLTCQNPPNCGTLSAPHTASGVATTYTAPSSLATNSTVVEIVAFATADHSQSVVAPITISTFNSTLKGTFVLAAQGVDSSFSPYQFAGVVVLDGSGNITSGEQTLNFVDPQAGLVSKADSIISTGSSYFIGSDGRGTLTLNPNNDTDIGPESFSIVFLSSSQALITPLPTNNLSVSGTGTMDLQASAPSAPSGGFAFVVSGLDIPKSLPLAFGGVFNIDSPGTISGKGSVTDEIVSNRVPVTGVSLSGTVTAPDQFGAVTLNLTAGFGQNGNPQPVQFTGYMVDSSHMKIIETDAFEGATSPFGVTAGLAIGQGSATGTFTDKTTFSPATYVFNILGTDLSNFNLSPATLTSVGLFTVDGSGNLNNGFTDTFLALNTFQGTVNVPQQGAQISAAFNGTYTVDSSGTGRASLTLENFNPNPKKGYDPVLFFYLTGTGSENTPLILQAGDAQYPSLGAGIAYPQSTTAAAFNGNYGFSFTQEQTGSLENDGTGQFNANATTTPPALSGVADVNFDFGENPAQPFTGIFATPVLTGPFAGTLVGTNNNVVSSVAFSPQIAVDYYTIDQGHGFFVETDLVTPGAQQNGQVSAGYYAARTPVCDGCQ
jgi:hypothetical protein